MQYLVFRVFKRERISYVDRADRSSVFEESMARNLD